MTYAISSGIHLPYPYPGVKAKVYGATPRLLTDFIDGSNINIKLMTND